MRTTAQDLEGALQSFFETFTLPAEDKQDLVDATGADVPDLDQVSTLEGAGADKGIILRLIDGREFQITIVQR